MSVQTTDEVQAQLGTDSMSPRILKAADETASTRQNYVVGGAPFPGRARWITTNPTDSAANQKTAILAGFA